MAKKTELTRAIENLEGQINNLTIALDTLRAVQRQKPTAKPRKPSIVTRETA